MIYVAADVAPGCKPVLYRQKTQANLPVWDRKNGDSPHGKLTEVFMNKRLIYRLMALLVTVLMLLSLVACGKATDGGTEKTETPTVTQSDNSQKSDNSNNSDNNPDNSGKNNSDRKNDNSGDNSGAKDSTLTNEATELDIDKLFTDRDLEQSPDLTGAIELQVSNGTVIDVTEEGVYRITGTAADCTVRVDAGEKAKVQLVLDGVSVTNSDFPVIYVVSADKCFVTLVGTSSLSVTGAFRADGSTNTDAVIFAKDDLVLNGNGTLSLSSSKGNGISGKDDIRITGGTYILETALDSIEANNSIAICGGTFTVNSGKDGLHSEDDEDSTVGWVYIGGGILTVNAKSDGIQGTTFVRIDGGNLKITGSEAIEGTFILINDGNFDLYGSDDGINASRKSRSFGTPAVVINDGNLKIEVGRGDTDAIDANGAIYVNGGTIDITAEGMSSFDYDSIAAFNGGTIIINGETVDSIPQSMFGPGGGPGWQGGPGDGRVRPDGQGNSGWNPPDSDGNGGWGRPDGEGNNGRGRSGQ